MVFNQNLGDGLFLSQSKQGLMLLHLTPLFHLLFSLVAQLAQTLFGKGVFRIDESFLLFPQLLLPHSLQLEGLYFDGRLKLCLELLTGGELFNQLRTESLLGLQSLGLLFQF